MSRPTKGRATLGGVVLHLLPAAVLAFLFAAVGIMHVTSRVLVVDAGYTLSQLEHQSRELTLTHDKLKLELATLKGPARLERLAQAQLGMVPPPSEAVLTPPVAATRLARGRSDWERPTLSSPRAELAQAPRREGRTP